MDIVNLIKRILYREKTQKVNEKDAGKIVSVINPDLLISAVQSVFSTPSVIPTGTIANRLIVDHNLPKEFEWIYKLGQIPKTMQIQLSFCGLLEYRGVKNNPTIIGWAKELKVESTYNEDSIAWCGLGQAIAAKRAGYVYPKRFLAAKSWAEYGTHVEKGAMSFGDIVVLNRDNNPALGHVARYIGEVDDYVCLYGANQSDSFCFAWFAKDRIFAVRRDPFKIGAPVSVKKYKLSRNGGLVSKNEA